MRIWKPPSLENTLRVMVVAHMPILGTMTTHSLQDLILRSLRACICSTMTSYGRLNTSLFTTTLSRIHTLGHGRQTTPFDETIWCGGEDLPVEIGPAEYVAMEHLSGFFSIPKDHFTKVEGVKLSLQTTPLPSFQERMMNLATLEFEGYPRIMNSLSFVLSLFPDAIIHQYDMFDASLTDHSTGYMEDNRFFTTILH